MAFSRYKRPFNIRKLPITPKSICLQNIFSFTHSHWRWKRENSKQYFHSISIYIPLKYRKMDEISCSLFRVMYFSNLLCLATSVHNTLHPRIMSCDVRHFQHWNNPFFVSLEKYSSSYISESQMYNSSSASCASYIYTGFPIYDRRHNKQGKTERKTTHLIFHHRHTDCGAVLQNVWYLIMISKRPI